MERIGFKFKKSRKFNDRKEYFKKQNFSRIFLIRIKRDNNKKKSNLVSSKPFLTGVYTTTNSLEDLHSYLNSKLSKNCKNIEKIIVILNLKNHENNHLSGKLYEK